MTSILYMPKLYLLFPTRTVTKHWHGSCTMHYSHASMKCPSDKENWRMKHEPTTDVTFTAVESGACAIHIARHFDGQKLKLPLTQVGAQETAKARVRLENITNEFVSFRLLQLQKVPNGDGGGGGAVLHRPHSGWSWGCVHADPQRLLGPPGSGRHGLRRLFCGHQTFPPTHALLMPRFGACGLTCVVPPAIRRW